MKLWEWLKKLSRAIFGEPEPLEAPFECMWGGPETAGCYHPGACGCKVM